MALSAGTAFIDVKPKLDKGFGTQLRTGLGGAIGGATKFAGTAALGIGAAIAGGAAVSLSEFASLEKGMNEVFTLLPGISEDAMGELTGQVKDFSKEFGVLPNDVVPALYQALSAGVPPDNVFEFLEVGQKAALGGVTELGTAVDGISSVVNAYGDDVIGAAEASDLMFTAVRLGKTNFEELSASLFNVVPTASALGVGFEDVTAALASMTAQGVPTSVATTQLRQLFVELSKEGTKTSEVFEKAAGQSFQEFIAAGGDTAGALEILQDASEESGTALQDLFGSVEAGSAALALTGGEGFTDALDEMRDSAGSTDAAFEQMDQGLSRTWDRIKAVFFTTLADIGERLAPFAQRFLDFFSDAMPAAIDTLSNVLGPVFDVIGAIFDTLTGLFTSAEDEADGFGDTIGSAFGPIGTIIQTVVDILTEAIGVIQEIFGIFGGLFDDAGGAATGFADTIGAIVTPIQTAFGFVRDVVTTVITAIKNAIANNADTIQGIFQNVMEVFRRVGEVAQIVFGFLQAFWDEWGGTITAIFQATFGVVIDILGGAFEVIKGIFDVFIGILTGDWSRAWEGIKSIFSGVWNAIKGIVEGIAEFFIAIFHRLFGNGIVVDTIKGGLDRILTFFAELPGKIIGFLSSLPGKLLQLGADLVAGLVNGLGNIASAVGSKIKSGISSAISGVKSFFGIGSPSKVFAEAIGAPLSEGIALGVADAAGGITSQLSDAIIGAQDAALANVNTSELELLNFTTGELPDIGDLLAGGTAAQAIEANVAALPATTAVDTRTTTGPDRLEAGTALAGRHIELHEGAVQINNPAPEPASTELPRTMRRLERRFAR